MPKVRITMEAEVGDLNSFWPNDPVGCTRQNVFDAVHKMHLITLEEIMDLMVSKDFKTPSGKARMKWLNQKKQLTKRLVDTMKFEIL